MEADQKGNEDEDEKEEARVALFRATARRWWLDGMLITVQEFQTGPSGFWV